MEIYSNIFLVDTMNQPIDNQELPTPESRLRHGIQVPTFADHTQHSTYESWFLLEANFFVHILHLELIKFVNK